MKKHFVNKALSAALLGCGLWTAGSAGAAVPDSVYLMAYNVHAGGGLNFGLECEPAGVEGDWARPCFH